MKIDVLTLFPAMFAGPLDESIIKRARQAGLLDLQLHQLRDWTHDRHKTVDDRPFGGGPGMLLKPEPIFEAVESLQREKTCVVLMSPSGRKFDQAIARELAQQEHLLIVTGHYEGFDERIREGLADDELIRWRGCCPEFWAMMRVQRMNRSATVCWNIRNGRGRRNFAG
jgi:tRNA (guanine37-N1)-methyltransferase